MNVSSLIARQREKFGTGVTRSLEFRLEQLRTLERMLESHEDDLLAALRADLGKSPHEAYASEIGFVLGEIRHAIRCLPSWIRPERRGAPWIAWPSRCHVRPAPYGVTLIIGPWNYPLQLLLSPLVGAIAAGNCAVLKPSECAPHTGELVERMVRSAFSDDYLAVVPGGRETSEMLLKEKFDHIFFTGGTETGRAVMAAAAAHLTPVTLELGGKCPCIVCHDAPLKTTARRIVWGKFMNAGQTCVAPDHVWADSRIATGLLDAVRETVREFYGESPRQSADYGRIINQRHFERLTGYLNDGTPICGGDSDAAERYIAPTVLVNVSEDAPVMKEEIFGPILPVLEFTDLGEVLEKLANRPKPLALYVFTHDAATRERVISRTHSGGVCVNDTVLQILGNELPFGGVGESGMGNYHGRASFDCFTHFRTVMNRSLAVDPGFRYPPADIPLRWLKRMLRIMG